MAHINKVVRSIEAGDGGQCVDIFLRPDGTFGFEQYRRDVEDRRGWFAIGAFADAVYPDQASALAAARARVAWLDDVLG